MTWLATCLLASPLVVPDVALAEDGEIEDLDNPESGRSKPTKTKPTKEAAPTKDELVREIERGFFAKANVGTTSYLMNFGVQATNPGMGPILRAGTTLGLGVGAEFIDNERSSAAWEVSFSQGVHNGWHWDSTQSAYNTGQITYESLIQGDTRTFALLGAVEYSMYPTRRLGVGLRAGGGILLAPLLFGSDAYENDIVPQVGSYLAVHSDPHPVVLGGPTFEYYTKLSHFSVGADVDAMYVVSFDMGVAVTGYMKYTF